MTSRSDALVRIAEIRQENRGGDVDVAVAAEWLCDLATAALRPVRPGHAAKEDMALRVVREDEPMATAVGDGIVAGRLDDLADHDGLRTVEAGNGDFDPVADVELHAPKSTGGAGLLTCPSCGGGGAQSGAHTELVWRCPTCDGKEVIHNVAS